MREDFALIIPARLNSSRLPRKVLKKIKNKTPLEIVYNICCKAVSKNKIFISTPDKEIIDFCKFKKFNFIKSSKDCKTGTDRVAEFSKKKRCKFYINVQADEILLNYISIAKVIKEMKKKTYSIVNLYKPISNKEEYLSLNVPKVVFNLKKELMYISRSKIPGSKKIEFKNSNKQVCVYGFTRKALIDFSNLKKKTPLESIEDIEILRFLEIGYKIKMIKTIGSNFSVDTLSDLRKARMMSLNNF